MDSIPDVAKVLDLIPPKLRGWFLLLLFLHPYLTRGIYAIRTGAGLRGFLRSIWCGTNTPSPKQTENQNPINMKILALVATAFLSVAAIALVETGCMTSKQTTVDANGKTNVVTVVNEANLTIDCEGLKLAAAGTVTVVLNQTHKDPAVVQALTDAHVSLDGILHGATTNTTQQVVSALQANSNPMLAKEAIAFVNSVSAIEQKYLAGVSASVAGEITTKIAQAVDDGLALGLNL